MNKDTPQERATKWQKRFVKMESDQEKLFKKTSKHYDIMYAVQSTDNIAPWRAKIYVPILASKAWDLISRISSVLPYYRTRIKDSIKMNEQGDYEVPKDVLDRQKRVDAKLMDDYANGRGEPTKLKVFDVMLDAVVAGTGFAKASWCYGEKKSYRREYDDLGLVKDMGKEIVKTEKHGYNDLEPVNFFNVFVSNKSTSFHKSRYVIVRYFKSIDEVKANPAYINTDQVADSQEKGNFDTYNQSRNRIANENTIEQPDETVPTATIYEVYENTPKGMMCGTYAIGKSKKGWVELEKPFKKYWHDQYPLQPFYIRRKTYSPWGESLFENNSSLQYATNDLFNHYLDNWNLSIDSMIMYEDGALTSDFIIEPGGEITYTGEKPDAFKFPEPNPAQLSMVMNVIDKAVENATVPQYLSGVPNSSIDKTAGTAKGITSISEAANEKIGYMRDNFKQSMVTVGRIWLSNLAQFQDKAEEVRAYEKGNEVPNVVLPEDYAGEIDLDIDDDSLVPMTKDDKRESLQALTSQAMLIQKAAIEQANFLGTKDYIPKINYQEIMDESVQYYAVKDPNRFILTEQEVAQATPEMPQETATLGEMVGGGQTNSMAQEQGNAGAQFGGYSQ